jgi:hypothetical protein
VLLDILDDVFLLHLPLEPSESALNGFALLNLDFSHPLQHPLTGFFLGSAIALLFNCPPSTHANGDEGLLKKAQRATLSWAGADSRAHYLAASTKYSGFSEPE